MAASVSAAQGAASAPAAINARLSSSQSTVHGTLLARQVRSLRRPPPPPPPATPLPAAALALGLAWPCSFLHHMCPSQAAHRRLHARGRRLAAAVAELSVETLKDVGGLLLFSAAPFVAVQALADSQWGKQLLERLEAEKPELQKQARQRERERRAARQQRCAAGVVGGAGWPLLDG